MQPPSIRSGPPPPGAAGPSGSIAFPRFESTTSEVAPHGHSHQRYPSTVSLATGRFSINRASALELHDLIYGSGSALNYSSSGSTAGSDARAAVERLYEQDAVYSNPLLTASSGDLIKDIHSLMHQFTAVSVPTPLSFVKSVFRRGSKSDWLNIAKVWSEVGEVLESDVYDGHRRVVIEHTVYLLLLPDLFPPDNSYRQDMIPMPTSASSLSPPESIGGTSFSIGGLNYGGSPRYVGSAAGGPATLGSATRLLMTLARQVSLPIHTRLSFNDSGRITHHQDIWDVKDVVSLVPGLAMAQWVGSRVVARSLASAFDVYAWAVGIDTGKGKDEERERDERGALDTISIGGGSRSTGNALGLHLSSERPSLKSRAPDNDS